MRTIGPSFYKKDIANIIILLFIFCIQSCSPLARHGVMKAIITDTSLLGNFTDDYKIRYTITGYTFTQHPGVTYHLISYNKKEQYLIACNDRSNVSDGGLFTRVDIMRFTNMEPWRWGFCLTAYKAASREEAEKTAAADRANPKKGCNGYPFSRMRRVPD